MMAKTSDESTEPEAPSMKSNFQLIEARPLWHDNLQKEQSVKTKAEEVIKKAYHYEHILRFVWPKPRSLVVLTSTRRPKHFRRVCFQL